MRRARQNRQVFSRRGGPLWPPARPGRPRGGAPTVWRALLALALLGAAGANAVPAGAPAPPPRLDVALAQGRITVGDRIEALLTLRVSAAELAGEPRFPTWSQGWGEVEVLEKGQPAKISASGDVAVYRQRLVLAAWQPGRVALPPVAVAVPLRAATVQAMSPANLALTVAAVLPPQKEGEKEPLPKPPAPARPLPLGAPLLGTAAALAAVCLGLGLLLWRRDRRRAKGEKAVPALAPLAELLSGLDRLAGERSAVALHTRLSLALRTYLGRALRFPAAESTTSEIHRRLAARVPAPLVRRTVEVLRACDLVKFARQEVGEERSRERLAAAREIGRDFETYLAPPPALPAAGETPAPLEKAG
jgi:hypothetical protein